MRISAPDPFAARIVAGGWWSGCAATLLRPSSPPCQRIDTHHTYALCIAATSRPSTGSGDKDLSVCVPPGWLEPALLPGAADVVAHGRFGRRDVLAGDRVDHQTVLVEGGAERALVQHPVVPPALERAAVQALGDVLGQAVAGQLHHREVK